MLLDFPAFPMRQVHLDFHTSPDIPDVGADWDPDHFVHTLKEARVNSITVFAKCHHGMNYYPTKIGPVHPALRFDLLGEQIEACHRAGIRCPVYISVVWDVSAAQRHPEWRQVDKDGRLVGPSPLEAGWPWLCVNTAYTDELIAQTEELMALYDCDGFFYDILMYHPNGCVCPNCLSDLRRAGRDPQNADHRRQHNREIARRFMARVSEVVRAKVPGAGIFYNSRFGLQFEDEQQYYSQVEIESLPTGGWGYGFYPLWSRYGRNFGLPMLGMTGRFHRSWADWGGLKHPDALKWECGGILATGGAVSVGDQLHPRGRLNGAVYEVIGEAFREVEAIEEFCVGAEPVSQVGLLVLDPNAEKAKQDSGDHTEGAGKMLLELHHQFDVITDRCPDFGRYELLVVPDYAVATSETGDRLRRFVADGGRLLLSHRALLDELGGNFLLADAMGVDHAGPAASNPDYFRVTDPALQTTVTRPGFAYSLYRGPATRVQPRPGTETLADAYETYFNRTGEHFCSHGFTPPLPNKADYPAVTRQENVIYIYGPVFGAYYQYGSLTFRAVVGRCLDLLLPQPVVETDAPATTEVTVMRQPTRQVVHLVNYSPQRRAPGHVEVLEAPVPLRDVLLRLHRPSQATTRVTLARSGDTLPFESKDGIVTTVVPRVGHHEAVVFE